MHTRISGVADHLAENDAHALYIARRILSNLPVDDGLLEDTARRIATLRAMPEGREGLAAFLEKRRAA